MKFIDLNSDLGENFGRYQMFDDAAILAHITSANIACGYHAGDALTMQQTVKAAAKCGVSIGAHPGLPDLLGFGRRQMAVTPDQVYAYTVHQISGLLGFCKITKRPLKHVKPHGALYNMSAKDINLANAIAQAVKTIDPTLILIGASGSALISAGQSLGLKTASEVFADRAYLADGSLAPRNMEGAILTNEAIIINQITDMVLHHRVKTISGEYIAINADTICLHGDHPESVALAQKIRSHLITCGIGIGSLDKVIAQ